MKELKKEYDQMLKDIGTARIFDGRGTGVDVYICDKCGERFATKFTSEKFGRFGLPTLLAAMEITEQNGEIDKLAREIDGADLLEYFSSGVWSCSRGNRDHVWISNGFYGYVYGCGLYLRYMAAPIVLLDVTADAFKKRTAGSVAP